MTNFYRIIRFLYLILLLFSISCKDNDFSKDIAKGAVQFQDSSFNRIDSLKGKVLQKISDSLVFSGTLMINNNYLIIDEIKSEKAIHLIKLPEEEYLGLYVSKGQGPGEILNIWPFLEAPKGYIRVLDNSNKKIVDYKIDSLLLNGTYSKEYRTGNVTMDGATIINENTYSLNHNSKANRIFVTDSSGSVIDKFGSFPEFEKVNLNEVSPDYYWSDMDYNSGIFAISYRFLPVIQLYDMEKDNWTILSGPDTFVHTTNYSDFSLYNNIKVTSNYIYALYNGKKFEGADWQHCNTVYVFNLKGEPVKEIYLNLGIKNFCIFNNILYGLKDDAEKGQLLIKYTLSNS